MAFPQTPLAITVELLLGGVWTAISTDLYARDDIVIKRGRSREGAQVDTSTCELTINNVDGHFTPRNPASPLYGLIGRNTPLRVSVLADSGLRYYRFAGEVSEWPTRWISGGLDVWVPIQASGVLRRLEAGSPPPRDAMRRFVDVHEAALLSYWPFTEDAGARSATEVAAGGQPIRALGQSGSFFQDQPEWGSGQLAPWLDDVAQLPQRKTGGTLTGSVSVADTTGWSVDHVRSGTGRVENLYLRDAGEGTNADPRVQWRLECDATTAGDTLKVYIEETDDTGATETLVDTVSSPGIYDADPHHVRLTVADDGASGTDWELYLDGALAASGNRSGVATQALSGVTYTWAAEDTSETTEAVALGHLAYWGTGAPHAIDAYRALLGHERERAGRRIERICAEDGVALTVHGDLDDTHEMGPQRPGALLMLLRAAEAVDGGTLGESRQEVALEYRTGRSRYNQGAAV
ncbi:hypothetical protein U9R90_05100 [Streptomyces sp. E11-3]|uniref:hypothetical protein n=1 Tax=Streptomyces sp. E11-3 TaxID=3110112 RepID=UPI00397F6682